MKKDLDLLRTEETCDREQSVISDKYEHQHSPDDKDFRLIPDPLDTVMHGKDIYQLYFGSLDIIGVNVFQCI